MEREAVFAGRWYPGEESELRKAISCYLEPHKLVDAPVRGIMAPHAGYIHSGAVAGASFASVSVPERVILLCPNHRDRRPDRPAFAVSGHEFWETPLGEIAMDQDLSRAIVAACPGAELDTEAHSEEHAIELQLPFLQVCNPQVKIVAISVGTLKFEDLERLGDVLAELIGPETLLVASSDMTHYESREIVFRKDQKALEKIEEFDGRGLLDICAREEISMCGRGPVVVMLKSCQRFGANNVKVLCRDTSKGAKNELAPVVGYAALAVY